MDANLSAALAAPFALDVNPGHKASSFPNRAGSLDSAVMARAQAVIGGWSGYAPTPLHELPEIAGHLGVARVVYKDESARFGLGSFKALGGAYAVAQLAAAEKKSRSRSGAADRCRTKLNVQAATRF